jgi:FkbM family methyltransferase
LGASMSFVTKTFAGRSFRVLDRVHHLFDQLEPPMEKYWHLIKRYEVVVDVGACYGQYALPALALGANVIAYEPFEEGRLVLKAQVEENVWEDRFDLERRALGNGAPYPTELSSEVWTKHYPTAMPEFSTLDEDMDEDRTDWDSVDWIKCDNEGGELLFLQGAAQTIDRCRPTIILENHEGVDPSSAVSTWPASIDSSNRMRAILTSMGYAIEEMRWDISRMFWVCKHPSRWA